MSEEADWETIGAEIDSSVLAASPTIENFEFTRAPALGCGDSQTIDLLALSSAHFSNEKPVQPAAKPRPPKEKPRAAQHTVLDKDSLIEELRNSPQDPPLQEPDPREVANLLLLGHVDAGKSTLCGRLLLSLHKLDERILKQYEQEAAENNRSSWWLAYAMDTSPEERERGKTIELGKAFLDLPHRRYILLDAPGHRGFVPNMVAGTAQADVVAIVLSARPGEFESGFERSGQSIEHALIAKGRGLSVFLVIVTKLDTVEYSAVRYSEIVGKFDAFLQERCKINAIFVPVSGLDGSNLLENPFSWYAGEPLVPLLDHLQLVRGPREGSLRVPVFDSYKDQGCVVSGKVERGVLVRDQPVLITPLNYRTEVQEIYSVEDTRMMYSLPGENVRVKLKLPETLRIPAGSVLCDVHDPCSVTSRFEAEILLLDLPRHRPVLSAGFDFVLHIATHTTMATVTQLTAAFDLKQQKLVRLHYALGHSKVIAIIEASEPLCIENDSLRIFCHFIMRDEDLTIGLGRVRKLL